MNRAPYVAAVSSSLKSSQSSGTIFRRCACGTHTGGATCSECRKKEVQRKAVDGCAVDEVPSIVADVLREPGTALSPSTRAFMEPRFGRDFSSVRIHTGERASQSAHAIHATAYASGSHIAFASGEFAPDTSRGRHLLAHELAHVAQQPDGAASRAERVAPDGTPAEHAADAAANAVAGGASIGTHTIADAGAVHRQTQPFIKQVKVHLTPPQNAELEWQGTPPPTAPGSDAFTVSTGKGYGDPGDPPKTCKRNCCTDAATQCASPHDKPKSVGSCCTYVGTNFWTGTPQDDHGGWKYWTPIQPHYGSRFIALHQHDEVTGKPIGHGCVRMEEANAERIARFSRGRRTGVSIDGNASPVLCEAARQCPGSGGSGGGTGSGGSGAGPGGGGATQGEGATGGETSAETSMAEEGSWLEGQLS